MYLAVDIGGTKTLLASFTPQGKLVKTHKFPTPETYSDFIITLKEQIIAYSKKDRFTAACLAVPGRLDRKNGVGIAFGSRPWRDVPIRAELETFMPWPILLENDTKLAGLSEALLIKKDFKKVLYVTISTGISSALIINGKIDPDTQDSEPGQMLLEHEGRLQDWEDFASGHAFQKKFGKRVGEITDPRAWYIIARNIAVGLINLIATYTPEVIVLGGGVGAHLDKFQDRLNEELKIYENPLLPNPPIRKAIRPEEAVVYGCYHLLQKHHGQTTR